MTKVCSRCGETHSIEFFNRDRTQPDGRYLQCTNCSRKACRRSYVNHLDEHREMKRMWKEQNRERHSEINREWRSANRDKMRAATARYKVALKQATPSWVDQNEIRAVYKARPPGYHVDHIEPLRGWDRCGLNVPWNLQHLPAAESFKKNGCVDGERPYLGQEAEPPMERAA